MRQHLQYAPGDDVSMTDTVQPANTSELSEILRFATEHDSPVIPFGGGTSLGTANTAEHSFIGIDMRRFSGVREYQPTDLTASFQAGTSLADVVGILGEHSQELPLDLPQAANGTIGGLVATGFSGPRRLGSGSLKDVIIGCGYVRGDGLIAKAGGMLVKNVSGFEISRLMHGSWGSLAVLTSVNVKVVPKPKADVTRSSAFARLDDALAAQRRLLTEYPTVAAAVTEGDDTGWSLHARLQGRRRALDAQVSAFSEDSGSEAGVSEGTAFWDGFNERWSTGDDVRLVIGAPGSLLERLAGEVAHWSGVRALAVSLGTGSLRVRIDPSAVSIEDMTARLHALSRGDTPPTWLIESAPVAWKVSGSVWPSDHQSTELMRDIKQAFDPAGILNRGRLFI